MIHVVDDDPAIRRALGRLLRSVGYEVRDFPSAEEYLANAPAGDASCVLLDVALPGIDGPALHARLRASGEETPVVYVTAHDEEATRARLGRLAPAGVFPKPVDVPALLALLGRVAPTR
jgi:FixJ family two-component response regulator